MVMVFALLSTVSPSSSVEVLGEQLAKTQVSNINMLRVKHTSFLFILVPPYAFPAREHGTGTRFYTFIFYTIFVNLSSENFEHL
jgi:hypothetical protein